MMIRCLRGITFPLVSTDNNHLLTLQSRPPPRSFLRRMSTRILAQPDADTYKAVKMPRGDYQRYFRHDKDGNYCGTEPEREWSEEEIKEQYDQYRDVPLRHILF